MAEKSKIIEVDGHKFMAEVPSPRDGSWIVANVTTADAKYLNPDVYGRIQDIILSKCFYLRDAGGQQLKQVFWANGKILVPDVDFDLVTVDNLFREALDFAVGPTLLRLMEHVAKETAAREAAAQLASSQPSSPKA